MRADGVVVVGGGLAGIAAAVRLAQHRVPVTLVETRKRLGGRATSFVDPTTGDVLDNCQHVLMRCCTNLLDLYETLGVAGRIEWHRRMYFADQAGHLDEMVADDLPAPLHMLRSILGFRTLTWRDKLAIGRGMTAIMQVSASARERLHNVSFANWLQRVGQPARTIEKFWSVVIVSACNETIDNVAASYALQVFQEGFLQHADAYEMGLPTVPLVELYDAAQQQLEAAGGEVLLSSSAERFEYDGRRVTVLRLADRQELAAAEFVSTVPFDRLAKLATPQMAQDDARLQSLDQFDVSPIIGIHLFFKLRGEQAVTELPHVALMDSPVHWLFNKKPQRDVSGQRIQHLHCVISAAYDLVNQSADDLISMAVAEVRRVLPKARHAVLAHGRVVKEKRATFSARPGIEAVRPDATGAIENLFLAGDWTKSGWPGTMEGAVRSGYLAAAAILQRRGIAVDRPIEPNLPTSFLYRLISG